MSETRDSLTELLRAVLAPADADAAIVDLDAHEAAITTPIYRERAHLLALLATHHLAVLVEDADPETPGWPVLYLDLPTGQASWHINPDDVALFGHVERLRTGDLIAPTWDGHTTEEKYDRVRRATEAGRG